MAATRAVIADRVGRDVPNRLHLDRDVRTIQRLLSAAGYPTADDGKWGPTTEKLLRNFQTAFGLPNTGYVDPNDSCLIKLLEQAGILIMLPGKNGLAGVFQLHDDFRRSGVTYEPGAATKAGGSHAYWGLDDMELYVVQTDHGQFTKGPVYMNCTTYVNLMLSVYYWGNAHNDDYDADCSCFGGTLGHLALERYGLQLNMRETDGKSVNYFTDAEQISASVNSAALYVIEIDHNRAEGVSHMTLLTNGKIYESTNRNGMSALTCISTGLREWTALVKKKYPHVIYYLFGPA